MSQAETVESEEQPQSTAVETNGADSGSGWMETLRSRLGLPVRQTLRDTLEDALKQGSESAEAFSSQERDMLLRILRFGALRVEDVMVPRADIIAIDERAPLSELLRVFEEAGHSRIPVYRETLDDLRGMIHIKDVVSWLGDCAGLPRKSQLEDEIAMLAAPETAKAPADFVSKNGSTKRNGQPQATLVQPRAFDFSKIDLSKPISSTKLRRDVLFVPPSMPAVNLLLRMQSTRVHLGLVVDEYGGTDGLVSIEDLVEEIVGAIEDEHDENGSELIVDVPNLGLVAAARTPIDELEAFLGVSLLNDEDEEDIDTLGGLVFSLAGHVPVRGELVKHPSGIEFEVLDADPRRIKRVRIHRQKNPDGNDPSDRPVDAVAAGSGQGPDTSENRAETKI